VTVKLSVVIPSYQRCERLRAALLSLAAQNVPMGQVEVIAALDGSTDGTGAMLSALGTPYRLRRADGPNRGPGAARNRGAALAEGDILLFLDDDITAAPGLLACHLGAHRAGADERMVCLGQVRTAPGQALSGWEAYLSARYGEHYAKLAAPGYRLDFWDCLSGNFSLARSLWERSGGFDPDFVMSRHEDIEFGYRLAGLGARFVYEPGALGYHHFTRSVEGGLRDADAEGASAQYLVEKYPDLADRLFGARLRRYPRALRRAARWAMRHPGGLRGAARLSAALLRLADALSPPAPLAARLALPVFRLAYHTHFWQGAAAYAEAGETRRAIPG
jgi:glycosyltransferase involved in cell wall biosynthesis